MERQCFNKRLQQVELQGRKRCSAPAEALEKRAELALHGLLRRLTFEVSRARRPQAGARRLDRMVRAHLALARELVANEWPPVVLRPLPGSASEAQRRRFLLRSQRVRVLETLC